MHGISWTLVAAWALGDTTSYIGTLLLHQLATQQLTGFIFAVTDILLIAQYLMYYQPEFIQLAQDDDDSIIENVRTSSLSQYINDSVGVGALGAVVAALSASSVGAFPIQSLIAQASKICNEGLEVSASVKMIGYLMGWVSGAFYFFGRIPQILKNYRRKSVSGLSREMFLFTITGNLLYG